MTAPVTPTPPAPIAPAPVERTFNNVIAKVANQTGIPADPVVATPEVKIVREAPKVPLADPVSADAPPAAATPDSGASSSPGEASASPPAASDAKSDAPADTAATVAAEPTEPTSELSLDDGTLILRAERNADGTFKTKFDPTAKLDFEIVDKGSGEKKAYSKTLPEIVRLAKDGVTLQAKVQAITPEVEYYRERVPQWQEQHETLTRTVADVEQQLADMTALNRELLSAPDDVVIRHRDEFANANKPEARLARLEQSLEQERREREQRAASQDLAAKAQTFIQSKLAAAVKEARTVYDADAVMGRLARITQPLTVRGRIPPEQWPALEREIKGPFMQWVAEGRARKAAETKKAAELAASTRSAQTAAQIAVNGAGSATAPVGRAAPDQPPAPPKAKNAKEVIDRLVHRPLPSTVGAGP